MPFKDPEKKAAYKRIWEEKNKEKRKEQSKVRKAKNIAFINNYLIKHPCDCGETTINKLTLHHLDPETKLHDLNNLKKCGKKVIIAELKKGPIKCKNCHTIIHNGTVLEKQNYLLNYYIKTNILTIKKRLLLSFYKCTLKCLKCEEKEANALLFHHINSIYKIRKISKLIYGSLKEVEKEFKKTLCLCQNCHEDFHCIYGRKKSEQAQIEEYLGFPVQGLEVRLKDYEPMLQEKLKYVDIF
jgi:hypothetical protein